MFYSFNLDPMTLVLKRDLDLVKMYLHTKNEVPSYSGSKVMAWTDKHTDRKTDRQTHTHIHTQTQVKLLPIRIRGWYNFNSTTSRNICVIRYGISLVTIPLLDFLQIRIQLKSFLGKLNCHQRHLSMPHEKHNHVYHLNLPPKFAIP